MHLGNFWNASTEKETKIIQKSFILLSKQNKTNFWGKMATNDRMRYFNIGENASSEQIYALLDDVESNEKD